MEAAIPALSPRKEHWVSPSSNAASGGLETRDRADNGVAAHEPVATTEGSPEVALPPPPTETP
ncbi:MAG: hypothetical protein SVX43_22570 [Cyanobacteriota bacterium]|nr:hypothetical protein [Cyanobacteriota bacterium]